MALTNTQPDSSLLLGPPPAGADPTPDPACSTGDPTVPPSDASNGDPEVRLRLPGSHHARIDAILAYAGLQLPAFPVSPRTKRPNLKGWQQWATDDGLQMYLRFANFPDANVGLLMGREIRPGEFVFALDLDPRNGGQLSFQRLREHRGRTRLPRTAMARTGGGGWHFLMTAPFPVNNGGLGPEYPGLDIKGGGGYIVVAPSIHPTTGRKYRWLRHPMRGIAKAPRWLAKILPGRPVHPPAIEVATPGPSSPPIPAPEQQTAAPVTPPARCDAVLAPSPAPEQRRAIPKTPPTGRESGPTPGPPGGERTGQVATLAAEIIARFPVPAVGHRWEQMRRAVGRLIGHGYGDDLVRVVLHRWYDHYYARGTIRTAKPEADHELDACIRTTRANPDFARSTSEADHRAQCRAIELDADLMRGIRSGAFLREQRESTLSDEATVSAAEGTAPVRIPGSIPPGKDGSPPPRPPGSKRVTRIGVRRCDAWNLSDREVAFVEALMVLVLHKIQTGEFARDGVIRMTDQQLVEIATDRHPEVTWVSNQQIERAKRKFIGRPSDDKPAGRFELLREIRKGDRKPGQAVGTPSEYDATGIVSLLGPAFGRTAEIPIPSAA